MKTLAFKFRTWVRQIKGQNFQFIAVEDYVKGE